MTFEYCDVMYLGITVQLSQYSDNITYLSLNVFFK